jgi:hypothetical protein
VKLSDPHLSGAVLADTSQLISGGQNVNSKLFSPWSAKLDAACSLIAGGGGCISATMLMAVDETWSRLCRVGYHLALPISGRSKHKMLPPIRRCRCRTKIAKSVESPHQSHPHLCMLQSPTTTVVKVAKRRSDRRSCRLLAERSSVTVAQVTSSPIRDTLERRVLH